MARSSTAMKLFVGDDINKAEAVSTSVDDMLDMATNRRGTFEQICREAISAECVCLSGGIHGKLVTKPFYDGRVIVMPDDMGITIWGRDPKDVLSFCLLYRGYDLTDFPEILRAYENFELPEEPLSKPSFRQYVSMILRRKLCSC